MIPIYECILTRRQRIPGRAAAYEKERAREALLSCLRDHVVDIRPSWTGKETDRTLAAGNPVAAFDCAVYRCDPPLRLGSRFMLEGGKSVVLVGPNGAGKSTILDAIMDRRHAGFADGSHGYGKGVHAKETLRISRLDQEELLSSISQLTTQEVLDMTMAHYKSQFPVNWDDWEEDAYDRNMANQDAEQRIETLIDQVVKLFEVEQFLGRKVSELSGGERTKLSLLMTLASEPDVLLLDEPTNHLDLESIAKLTGLFQSYVRGGVSVLNVSHVEWFLDMVGTDGTIELSMDRDSREAVQSTSPHRKFKKKEKRRAAISGSIEWGPSAKEPISNLFMADAKLTVPRSPLSKIDLPTFQGGAITVFSGKNGTGKTKLMVELADPHSQVV